MKHKRPRIAPEPNPLSGKWVQVYTSHISNYARTALFGRVLDVDDAFLYIEQLDGDQLVLPRKAIIDIREVDVPKPIPGGTLLRPTDSPDSGQLLRPASNANESDAEKLLRPAGSE